MAGLIERLWDHVSKEGNVIGQAKVLFCLAALLVGCLTATATWFAAGSFYSEHIAVLGQTIDYQKTQIDDLRNRVQAVGSAAPAPNTLHAQVTPLFLKFFPASADSKRPYVNFGVINISPVPARGATSHGYMKVFDKLLTSEEEDKVILDLKTESNFPNPKLATNQLSYGEYTYNTANNKDESDDEKIDLVKAGKKFLYVFFVGQFTDDNQPKDEKYTIERCAVFFNSMDVIGTCHGHNQTYAEKLK